MSAGGTPGSRDAGPPPDRTPPGPRPETLSAEDDAWLGDLAARIARRGLTAPAVLWLESLRPVSFLGSQVLHFLSPIVQLVVPTASLPRLAEILEERSHLERMLEHLETAADAGDASGDRSSASDPDAGSET